MHPVIGAEVESERLYVAQSRLAERLLGPGPALVLFDVGLGAAGNALAAIRAARVAPPGRRPLAVVSFERELGALALACSDEGAAPARLGGGRGRGGPRAPAGRAPRGARAHLGTPAGRRPGAAGRRAAPRRRGLLGPLLTQGEWTALDRRRLRLPGRPLRPGRGALHLLDGHLRPVRAAPGRIRGRSRRRLRPQGGDHRGDAPAGAAGPAARRPLADAAAPFVGAVSGRRAGGCAGADLRHAAVRQARIAFVPAGRVPPARWSRRSSAAGPRDTGTAGGWRRGTRGPWRPLPARPAEAARRRATPRRLGRPGPKATRSPLLRGEIRAFTRGRPRKASASTPTRTRGRPGLPPACLAATPFRQAPGVASSGAASAAPQSRSRDGAAPRRMLHPVAATTPPRGARTSGAETRRTHGRRPTEGASLAKHRGSKEPEAGRRDEPQWPTHQQHEHPQDPVHPAPRARRVGPAASAKNVAARIPTTRKPPRSSR